jgi:hypothetical protein
MHILELDQSIPHPDNMPDDGQADQPVQNQDAFANLRTEDFIDEDFDDEADTRQVDLAARRPLGMLAVADSTHHAEPSQSTVDRDAAELLSQVWPRIESHASQLPPHVPRVVNLPEAVEVPNIDPTILKIAADPDNVQNMPLTEFKAAAVEARRLAAEDAMLRNKRIVRGEDGTAYWAAEYPTVFSFTGEMRGTFNLVPKDPSQWTPAMAMLQNNDAIGGNKNQVIIETDAGEVIRVCRTSPDATLSGYKQTFQLYSNTMAERGQKDPRPIDQSMLAYAVVVPGMRMKLGMDPATGRNLGSRGNVTRITAIKMNDQNKVASNHGWLKQPDKQSDVLQRYQAAIEAAL